MPLLDLIRIAEPCGVPWSSMTGTDRARHCGHCDKTVFDLTTLTRAEAEALLVENRDICARIGERADGSLVLADGLVRRKRRVVALAAAAALAGGLALALRESDAQPIAIDEVGLTEPTPSTAMPVRLSEADDDRQLRERAIEDARNSGILGTLVTDEIHYSGGALAGTADFSEAFESEQR